MARGIGNRQKLNIGKEARRRARWKVGLPPKTKVVPDKRRKPPKHKKDYLEEE
jgi:hypothetical protein